MAAKRKIFVYQQIQLIHYYQLERSNFSSFNSGCDSVFWHTFSKLQLWVNLLITHRNSHPKSD